VGSVDGVRTTAGLIVKEYRVPEPVPMLSVGVTVKLTVPVEVGVPMRLMVPVPLPEIVSPVVFVIPDNARVIVPEPPRPLIVWLYPRPTSPPGRVVGVRVVGESTANE
jgi:hypothetical protein